MDSKNFSAKLGGKAIEKMLSSFKMIVCWTLDFSKGAFFSYFIKFKNKTLVSGTPYALNYKFY